MIKFNILHKNLTKGEVMQEDENFLHCLQDSWRPKNGKM